MSIATWQLYVMCREIELGVYGLGYRMSTGLQPLEFRQLSTWFDRSQLSQYFTYHVLVFYYSRLWRCRLKLLRTRVFFGWQWSTKTALFCSRSKNLTHYYHISKFACLYRAVFACTRIISSFRLEPAWRATLYYSRSIN